MGYTTLERMKSALLTTTVTSLERTVLLDMAIAVDDGSLIYSWGHDRLARAIGKEPGSTAAKQALSYRIIPSLISKGLIRLKSKAYSGHRAEYELLVLMGNGSSSEMGNGSDEIAQAPTSRASHAASGVGNGSKSEWVTVSEGMGNTQTVTPLPSSLPRTPTGKCIASDARRPSDRQITFIGDLRLLLGLDDLEPVILNTAADADALISEYWQEVERRAHNGEIFQCTLADLSLAGRAHARKRGLLLMESEAQSA